MKIPIIFQQMLIKNKASLIFQNNQYWESTAFFNLSLFQAVAISLILQQIILKQQDIKQNFDLLMQIFSLFLISQILMQPSLRKISESVSNFIEKTYEILQQKQNDTIIGWAPKGVSFLIKDVKLFESLILPKYFKHSNFSSFVRQLNMYNFHKVRGQKNENQFEHQKFKRDNRELLSTIKRKNHQLSFISATSIQKYQANQPLSIDSPLKQAQNVPSEDEQHGKQNNENQNSFTTLEQLRQKNRYLRKSKQNEQAKLKSMSSVNQTSVAQKFYKLVASLLTQKIKKQMNLFSKIDKELNQNGSIFQQKDLPRSFDDLISHVVESQQPMEFQNYQRSAKLLISKHNDHNFMLRKSTKAPSSQND